MSRRKKYLKLLQKSFNEEEFIHFVIDLLNLNQSDLNSDLKEEIIELKQYKDNIHYYKYLAKYNDGLNDIGVFIVNLKSTESRSLQRNFVGGLLNRFNLDASIVAFYSPDQSTWRLSFVKKELSFTEKGIKQDLTPAKRYSYLVGENEAVHTAKKYLFKLLKIDDRKVTLNDIEKVFSVEKVTKEFFEEYKERYLLLKEYLDSNKYFVSESEKYDFNSSEFAKKLMGQIVFLYFLQKKGWLGVGLIPEELTVVEYNNIYSKNDKVSQSLLESFYILNDNLYTLNLKDIQTENNRDVLNLSNLFVNSEYDKPWGSGKPDFIRHLFEQANESDVNFFEQKLEPFFYSALNENRENQYFPLFNSKIPFLNGGLFEPLNNYRWYSSHFKIPNILFSNSDKTGILDFLDLYNFTIDEEEPLEKDIAVDPEMLGKIFENLLDVDDRKSKGAFYTPREIVFYMCQESLANYISNKININVDEIMEFIKHGDLISEIDRAEYLEGKEDYIISKSIYDNILKIDKALINVKIADPAVGSGAFPLGILTEIVNIRTNLTTYLYLQTKKGELPKDTLYKGVHSKRDLYNLKLQTIENSIYAVDIDNSAIDIAKLRLWLSLIVDYPSNKSPKPLPNLDFKIRQGNSLLDEYKGVELFSEKMLENNLKNYRRKKSSITEVDDINMQLVLLAEAHDLNQYIETMLELQKEFFITFDNKIKQDLKDKIDEIQIDLVKQSLINERKKIKEFDQLSHKRTKPWFIWKLDFFEVFKSNGGFDIVIGNPPYIDSESMVNDDPEVRKTYTNKYKFAKGNWDIYIIFFELAYNLLNDIGNLIYITPDKWVARPFGDTMRTKLFQNIRSVLIAGHDVFESANVDSIITNIDKSITSHINISHYGSDNSTLIRKNLLSEPYRFDIFFSKHLSLLLKIEDGKEFLSNKFNVKTENACSTSDAYKLKEIILNDNLFNANEKYDIVNTGTIKPFGNLLGKKEMTYLGEKYLNPIVYKEEFHDKFKNKYSTMVGTPKIVLKGLNLLHAFIDKKGNILPGKTTLAIQSQNIESLKMILAFLHSDVMKFYINEKYSASSYNRGITFTKEMINNIPIPTMNKSQINEIIDLVDKILCGCNQDDIEKLNEYIISIYNLSDDENNIIRNYRK